MEQFFNAIPFSFKFEQLNLNESSESYHSIITILANIFHDNINANFILTLTLFFSILDRGSG